MNAASGQRLTWPIGDGEMARRIRKHDWAATPLGPIESWPQSLRTTIDLCLSSAVPSYVWWGPDLTQLYNDAALPINRAKHPGFLGQPAREAWADVWTEVGDLFAQVVSTGASVRGDDLPMVPDRGGPVETARFTFSYGPARDETGAVAGVFCTAIESSARIRAEQSLRESEQRYRALFTAMDEGYARYRIVAGADGTPVDMEILEVNPAYERLMQRPAPVGKRLQAVEPTLDQDWLDALASVAASGQPQRFERYNARLDRWFDIHVTPGSDDPAVVVLIFSDVTERRRGEVALRASEERQAFLLHLSDALRPLADPERIQAEAMRLLGERLGCAWAFYGAFDHPLTRMTVNACSTHGDVASLVGIWPVASFAFREPMTAGQMVVVPEMATHPLVSEGTRAQFGALGMRSFAAAPVVKKGILLGGLAVADTAPRTWTDDDLRLISEVAERTWAAAEQAQAEAALRASEERYRTLFASIDEGYALYEVLFDETGNPVDVRIHEVNPAYERLTGRRQPVGKTLNQVSQGLDHAWAAAMAGVVRTGEPVRFEGHNAEIDRWFDVYIAPVDGPGDPRIVLVLNDITERKRAEDELRERERRMRRTLSVPKVGVLYFDLAGHMLDANAAFAQMSGYTVEELRATAHWENLTAPEFLELTAERAHDLAVRGETPPYEKEMIRKDGTRWWGLFAPTRLNGSGSLSECVEFIIDITETKQAEYARRESEERFRSFAENSTDTLWIVDAATGHLDYLSPAFEQTWGEPRDAIVRSLSRWTELVHPDDRATATQAMPRALAGKTHVAQYRIVRADGEVRWIHDTGFPIRDAAGVVRRVAGIAQDITGQRQAMEALRASEERYRLIVEEATDYGIFTTDIAGCIETWPSGAQRVFGWPAAEAIGQPVAITFTPEDRAAGVPEREFGIARDEGQTPNVRWHQRNDGSRVFIEGTTYARRGEDGAFQGVFKIGQDVTARLVMEETRREEEAARWEEEERVREELAGQVAMATVELRTLSQRLLVVQEEERRHLARELHDEIGQVLTGLNFQLAAASGANGTAALAEAQATVQTLTEQVRQLSMDLRPVVLDSFGLLPALEWHIERFQERLGIAVHLRHHGLDRRFLPEVEIGAFRVVQEALTNVARHAQTDFATIQLLADAGVLTIVVKDRGRGFSLSKDPMTSGLGGMRERVALLGGTLEIESAPGAGTAITAEIPLGEQDDPNPASSVDLEDGP